MYFSYIGRSVTGTKTCISPGSTIKVDFGEDLFEYGFYRMRLRSFLGRK